MSARVNATALVAPTASCLVALWPVIRRYARDA